MYAHIDAIGPVSPGFFVVYSFCFVGYRYAVAYKLQFLYLYVFNVTYNHRNELSR